MQASGVTVRTDSEQYSGAEEVSMSPPPSSGISSTRPLPAANAMGAHPAGAAINLLLPFINGDDARVRRTVRARSGVQVRMGRHKNGRLLSCSPVLVGVASHPSQPPCRLQPVTDVDRSRYSPSRKRSHPIGPEVEGVEKWNPWLNL